MQPDSRVTERPQDLLAYERGFWGRGRSVAGVDEAGRGPLAGPVVAAAVVLPEGVLIDGADDSAAGMRTVHDPVDAACPAVRECAPCRRWHC